jgi:hypothetical protein
MLGFTFSNERQRGVFDRPRITTCCVGEQNHKRCLPKLPVTPAYDTLITFEMKMQFTSYLCLSPERRRESGETW